MKNLLLLALLLFACFASAQAQDMVSEAGCTMQETASLSTNWNGVSETVKAVRGMFDGRMKQIQEYGKKAGIEKLELQSQSYNIYAQNTGMSSGSGFQYNGNASFMVKPADKAADLLELLTKNGIQSSLNVNMYKSGSCQ